MVYVSDEDLLSAVKKYDQDAKIIRIDSKELIFEERVKWTCFYCARYNVSWKCPPKIPDIDYQKMMGEYENVALVWVDIPFTEQTYSSVRIESTNMLHHLLLNLESYLRDCGAEMPTSFIGGSCKLCKTGCGKEKCNNPYLARTPIEATGVNVVKSAKKYGIDIVFPVKSHLMRLGLLLW